MSEGESAHSWMGVVTGVAATGWSLDHKNSSSLRVSTGDDEQRRVLGDVPAEGATESDFVLLVLLYAGWLTPCLPRLLPTMSHPFTEKSLQM